MYTDLATIKRQLNIETTYTDEDTYLTHLYNVAEDAVERHLDIPLEYLEDSSNNIPSAVIHAMLLMIGTMYNFRESEIVGSTTSINHAYDYLLSLYKDYSGYYCGESYASIVDEIARHLIIEDGCVKYDTAFINHCSKIEGKKGATYQRLMDKIASTAVINTEGNIIINV